MIRKIIGLIVTVVVMLPAAPAAIAQDENILEEITVTAQRREQNLEEVPIAITAFTGAQIDRLNVTGARDFLALTPNVSFTDDGQAGSRGLGLAIRGINNLVSGENAFINSIGIYIDEFSVASVPNQVANPQYSSCLSMWFTTLGCQTLLPWGVGIPLSVRRKAMARQESFSSTSHRNMSRTTWTWVSRISRCARASPARGT